MKPITFSQFVSLVECADKTVIDTDVVECYSIIDEGSAIEFSWTDDEFQIFEVNVDDDKEFFFDSNKGRVTFKDSDGIEVVVYFYMEVPLTEIPSDS